jgi:uncharacterized protein
MAELTLQRPDTRYFIRGAGPDGVVVVDRAIPGSLIVSAERLEEDWAPKRVEDIGETHIEQILEFEPEVILLGTGARQGFLPPALIARCYGEGVGIEVMTTRAACRTFNVLIAEERRAVAALLPIGD